MTQKSIKITHSLGKQPRVRETIILGFLFLCGALSVLITIGIVYQLGRESLLFFNQQQWESTSKSSVASRSGKSSSLPSAATTARNIPSHTSAFAPSISKVVSVGTKRWRASASSTRAVMSGRRRLTDHSPTRQALLHDNLMTG